MHAKLVPRVFLARWLNRTLSHSKSVGNDAAKKNTAVAVFAENETDQKCKLKFLFVCKTSQ
jgi:hypothetical protein